MTAFSAPYPTKAIVLLLLIVPAFARIAEGQPPGDEAAQERWKAFYSQVVRFQKDAAGSFNREMDREKTDPCRRALSTRAILECLGKENEATAVNYKAYFDALHSLLALASGNGDSQTPGPTGVPLASTELVEELDGAEAAWQKYRQMQCAAAFDLYKGGTAAAPPVKFMRTDAGSEPYARTGKDLLYPSAQLSGKRGCSWFAKGDATSLILRGAPHGCCQVCRKTYRRRDTSDTVRPR